MSDLHLFLMLEFVISTLVTEVALTVVDVVTAKITYNNGLTTRIPGVFESRPGAMLLVGVAGGACLTLLSWLLLSI